MSKPRLMILGGSSSQLSLIKKARDMGFFTILADQNSQVEGRSYADSFFPASTFDIDAVYHVAKDAKVQAITTIGTDQPILTATVVSNRLGLPTPLDNNQAMAVTNKAVMKPTLHQKGIPTLPFILLDKAFSSNEIKALNTLSKPWVVKPVDSQGQRGINIVNNLTELRAQIPQALKHSRDHRVIIEEYYDSKEMTVSGWVNSLGKLELWTISDRVTFPLNMPKNHQMSLGVCLAHRYPSSVADGNESMVKEIMQEICNAFNLINTPIYVQLLSGSKGIMVNEVACRLGGAYEDIWIPMVTGIDILGKQLDWYAQKIENNHTENAIGISNTQSKNHVVCKTVAVPLLFAHPGKIKEYSDIAAIRGHKYIYDFQTILPPGTVISNMENSSQRLGYAIICAPDKKKLNTSIYNFFDTFKVINTEDENILMDMRVETSYKFGIE